MTDRKPPTVSWETWIERQIREAQERGEFDNLPGAGKPIADLEHPHDELWWVRQMLKREQLSYLPPSLALRKDVEDSLEQIGKERTESAVRAIAAAINSKIIEANRMPLPGPPSTLMPLDVEHIVQTWQKGRA
jgi:hypothetical protein